MRRIRSKRLIVAAACAAALSLIGAGCAGVQTSKAPAFARIALSENSAVSIQIQGDQLRAAMSDAEAQAAAPVKAGPEFTLPVPADQLPAGVTAIKASLSLTQYQSGANAAIVGHLTVCRTDAEKAEWKYVSQLSVPAGPNWDHAQTSSCPIRLTRRPAWKPHPPRENCPSASDLHSTAPR